MPVAGVTLPGGSVARVEQLEHFRAVLAEHGLKLTKQREAIAEVFFDSGRHLSLVELLARARARQPSVGYATVYRTMKVLAETGLATEHKFAEGNARYEPAIAGHHHDHLICVTCGRIVEVEDDRIEAIQDEMAAERGFRVISHRHEIYAECVTPNCPQKELPQETDAHALRIAGLPSTS